MIPHPAFSVDPWSVGETELNLDVLAQAESVFALSNGHIGLRGNLDEGEPHGLPGTYLNGFYEVRPLPYAEAGYGYPEDGQTVVNVTNGKIIRLLVDDEPFDIRYGRLLAHERVLDLRAGVLRRATDWESPARRRVRVSSVRLVSFVQRSVAAILYEVEPVDAATRIVVQSELEANEPMPPMSRDPRAAALLAAPLQSEMSVSRDQRAMLAHSTRASGLRMAAGMDHEIRCSGRYGALIESAADLARLTITTDLQPGQTLRIVKYLGYAWSSRRSLDSVRDQVDAAVAEARHTGWERLLAGQREYLDAFWRCGDVELDGDAELQQAVRFALFHTLQAGARAERRAIPAKGLTGPGYDGHAFWDTESFVLQVLTYTAPDAAGDALRWRHSILDFARERARLLNLQGAAFPWRTIRGHECSAYWPAGTAAFHINADIADAVARYHAASEDDDFMREVGTELLVETARLWRSLGHHDADGMFRIDGVTGPDEYSALSDNNVYTNLMAQRNLRAAAEAAEQYPDPAAALGVDHEETAGWRDAAKTMLVPYDERLRVHPQSEGFTRHQVWDFASTPEDHYPLLLHYSYFDLYRKQVVKQADLVLAMHLRGDAFREEDKARNFAYYEALTVRDSSLSACTQAVMAAEVGHMELAYDYFAEAALMDLDDLEHNTADGVHIASLAGAWIAAVAGFGGMRDHDGRLTFAPRLPPALRRMTFGVGFKRRWIRVEVTHDVARYRLGSGPPLEIAHHGSPQTVTTEEETVLPIPDAPQRQRPGQPPGRQPARRRPPLRWVAPSSSVPSVSSANPPEGAAP
ncbi:MAG TPA: glycosyl hydrolase family 65 protein [Candidatus Dormibacteraeota bacterium]|nr:glycosyl hydrolase family 65 protein [Candidatus Dormibacteraeota bacterium]